MYIIFSFKEYRSKKVALTTHTFWIPILQPIYLKDNCMFQGMNLMYCKSSAFIYSQKGVHTRDLRKGSGVQQIYVANYIFNNITG